MPTCVPGGHCESVNRIDNLDESSRGDEQDSPSVLWFQDALSRSVAEGMPNAASFKLPSFIYCAQGKRSGCSPIVPCGQGPKRLIDL